MIITLTALSNMPNGVLFWVDIDRVLFRVDTDRPPQAIPVRDEFLTFPLAAGEGVRYVFQTFPGAEIAVDVYDESRGRDPDDQYDTTVPNCDSGSAVPGAGVPVDDESQTVAMGADIPFDPRSSSHPRFLRLADESLVTDRRAGCGARPARGLVRHSRFATGGCGRATAVARHRRMAHPGPCRTSTSTSPPMTTSPSRVAVAAAAWCLHCGRQRLERRPDYRHGRP